MFFFLFVVLNCSKKNLFIFCCPLNWWDNTSSDGWTRLVTASLAYLQTLHNEAQQTRLESNIRVLAKLLDIVKCQCSVSDEAPSPSETRLLLDAVLACHQSYSDVLLMSSQLVRMLRRTASIRSLVDRRCQERRKSLWHSVCRSA